MVSIRFVVNVNEDKCKDCKHNRRDAIEWCNYCITCVHDNNVNEEDNFEEMEE